MIWAEEKAGVASVQQHCFLQGATILKGLGSGEHAEEGRPKMSAGAASRYNYKISCHRMMLCMPSSSFACTDWSSPPLLSATYAKGSCLGYRKPRSPSVPAPSPIHSSVLIISEKRDEAEWSWLHYLPIKPAKGERRDVKWLQGLLSSIESKGEVYL
ncbi:hypothetical protein MHYP_G00256290 [Metynnis hypsauchen]